MKCVKEIVREYLVSIGADGLCGDVCGCGLDDLMPCSLCTIGIDQCIPAIAKVITQADKDDDDNYWGGEFEVGDHYYVEMEDRTEVGQLTATEDRINELEKK